MRAKTFIVLLISALLVFVTFNYVMWKCCTEVLLTKKFDGGDLARMGYALDSKQYRKAANDLPRRHIILSQYSSQKIDVMTIGDSFSIGGGEGLNNFYQDYIATLNDCTVLNITPYPTDDLVMYFSPFSTLAVLMNSGYLDKIHPKNIVIESAVRYCLPRFVRPPLDSRYTDSIDNIRNHYAKIHYSLFSLPKTGFINNGNFKYAFFNLFYLFSDNALMNRVYRVRLTQPLFTAENARQLLFVSDDIKSISMVNKATVSKLNDNFNTLASILKQKGIKLYFMPIVDKYDLYSEFIAGNPYPKNPFFDELRALPKDYTLIDTKAILLNELRKGEKDIYYADDSHWTCKAERKIFETVRFERSSGVGPSGKPLASQRIH